MGTDCLRFAHTERPIVESNPYKTETQLLFFTQTLDRSILT